MSYKSLLKHRATIMRQDIDLRTGSAEYAWVEHKTNVPCYIDLNFIRRGKDPLWTNEAGRRSERTGVCFFDPKLDIQEADWIKITKGPAGVFSIETAIDEAWRPENRHHLEVSVKEVAQQVVPRTLPINDNVPQFPDVQREDIEEINEMSPQAQGPFADIPGME